MADLIDRDELIIYLDKRMTYEAMEGRNKAYIKGVRDAIADAKAQPTVDAVPVRRGRWIPEPDRLYHWHCSECEFTEGIVARFYRFCPNCGADMQDGEKDD